MQNTDLTERTNKIKTKTTYNGHPLRGDFLCGGGEAGASVGSPPTKICKTK